MDQIEIARLLGGNDGVHRVAFVRKGLDFAPGEREKWLEAFSKAYKAIRCSWNVKSIPR
jgi:hypothetical protein